jgi:DNA-binding transcriptional ArsR family regulator
MTNMLESLITSKTRIKILLKFFLNSKNTAYLRSLEPDFGESTNAIRQELNRFEKAGLLLAEQEGNKKMYRVNTKHPLFPDIRSLLVKHVGIDKVLDKIVNKLGNLFSVYLVGELAKGNDSKIIDLWFVGDGIDKNYLLELTEKAEEAIKKKIRYLTIRPEELADFLKTKSSGEVLLLWEKG